MARLRERISSGRLVPPPVLSRLVLGTGEILSEDGCWTLTLPRADRNHYSDAQLQDYAGLARRDFPWRPPLAFAIRARLSPQTRGTAGFGFWNNPLAPLGGIPALPQAAWFLWASPPSAMELAQGIPGSGWKAATIDACRPAALRWAPLAPAVLLACRHPGVRRRLWPRVQRALAVDERVLRHDPDEWHTYEIIWLRDRVIFGVDGRRVLVSRDAPRGPLGLVIWIDNQWARVTPAGSIGWGLLDTEAPQSLQWSDLRIICSGLAPEEA
jgi:hypothetical protein